MSTRVSDMQDGFKGGLNTTASPSELESTELRTAENCRLTSFGAVVKRFGTQRTSAATLGGSALIDPVRGGIAWFQPSSTTEMAVRNGVLYTSPANAIPMTWTAQAGALSTSAYPSFAGFRDATGECMYIADGGKLNKYKAGALTVDIAVTPAAISRVAVQNARLFGISGVDQTLYYSGLNNGDTLGDPATADAGSQVVRTFSSQELTGLGALGQSLIMFHRAGISRFTGYGNDDITIASGTRGISADVGTIAPDSFIAVENVGYFLSDRGFYAITESGVKSLSAKIDSVMTDFTFNNINQVKVLHNRTYREVWWWLPAIGIYIYNYRLDSWSGPLTGIYVTPDVHSMWETRDSLNKPVIMTGHAYGHVRKGDIGVKDDVLSDGTAGQAFTMNAQCHRMYCGTPESEIAYRFIEVEGDTGASALTTVAWATETASSSAVFAAHVAGQISSRAQANGRGKYIDVTLSDSSIVATPNFSRVVVKGFSYGERY